jgi:hypothetical protein
MDWYRIGNAPRIRVAVTITDAATGAPVKAAVFAENQRMALEVSEQTLTMPGDGQRHELRVEAADYRVWVLQVSGQYGPTKILRLPVRLVRLAPIADSR